MSKTENIEAELNILLDKYETKLVSAFKLIGKEFMQECQQLISTQSTERILDVEMKDVKAQPILADTQIKLNMDDLFPKFMAIK